MDVKKWTTNAGPRAVHVKANLTKSNKRLWNAPGNNCETAKLHKLRALNSREKAAEPLTQPFKNLVPPSFLIWTSRAVDSVRYRTNHTGQHFLPKLLFPRHSAPCSSPIFRDVLKGKKKLIQQDQRDALHHFPRNTGMQRTGTAPSSRKGWGTPQRAKPVTCHRSRASGILPHPHHIPPLPAPGETKKSNRRFVLSSPSFC